jgi:acylphosphatase
MKLRAMVTIKGRVQGVSFRHYTQQAALQHNVTGWVSNLPDGNVAGCFEGEERDVRTLIDWCRRGPDWAHVDEVLVEDEPYRGEFTRFNIRY